MERRVSIRFFVLAVVEISGLLQFLVWLARRLCGGKCWLWFDEFLSWLVKALVGFLVLYNDARVVVVEMTLCFIKLSFGFMEVTIFGIPVPTRPDLSVVDNTSTGTLPSDEAVVDGAVSEVHSLGVESICFDINLFSRVFSKKLRMVKCIPLKLRLGFAKLFRSALDNVLVNPGDLPVERERCQFECISRVILRWRDPVDVLRLVSDCLAELTPSFSGVKKSNKHEEANVLEAKHPYAPLLTLSSFPLDVDALSVNKDLVLNRIHSFPKGTSCSRDGLRAQHLMDILGGAASAVADDLLGSITEVVNMFLSGKCPSQLGEYIASAPLTPLVKPGGGIRPIAVETMWQRLVFKVASSSISNSMNTYLQDFQFGVGVPGGCEAVLHSVNRLNESKGKEVRLSLLLVDFKNAFNLVDKSVLLEEARARCPSIARWVEFCYARHARLYYDDSVLWSCQGVQQGDPLGLLLFFRALHPLVQTINQSCELTLQAWYLDDDTIVGDTLMVAKALNIIKNDGLARGLFLHVDKTELFWPGKDPRRPGFGDWQWRLSTLPIKLGGLGILSAEDIIHLDIDDSDLHLTPVLRSSRSAHVEPSPYTQNPVTIIPDPTGVVQLSNSICVEPSSSTPNPVRIIPGPAGLVQRVKLLKENVFILYPDGALMSTQEYMQKVFGDMGEVADFNSGAWVSATNYVNAFGGTVTRCLGDIDNFLKKEKLEQVVAIVKSCSPNALGDLNVTVKDLSGTVPRTIHYKVLDMGSYEKDITVGVVMILANVSVFTTKPSKHYLNITKRNVVEVFCKDTVSLA
nr:hypothetical protein [Tanacetum cinerariifolium]